MNYNLRLKPIISAPLEKEPQLGKWLKINGEAIYGTRPYSRAEAITTDSLAVRYTQRGDTLYAILLGKPGNTYVTIPGLALPADTRITLLGRRGGLAWRMEKGMVRIRFPKWLADSPAYALRIAAGAKP